jgi:hypothetical protein
MKACLFDRRGPIPPVARDKPLIGPRNRPRIDFPKSGKFPPPRRRQPAARYVDMTNSPRPLRK